MAPDEYASALGRLHAGMRHADVTGDWLPHFMDRVDEAQRLVDDPTNNPAIGGADRELLGTTLRTMRRTIVGPSSCCTASRTPAMCSGRGTALLTRACQVFKEDGRTSEDMSFAFPVTSMFVRSLMDMGNRRCGMEPCTDGRGVHDSVAVLA